MSSTVETGYDSPTPSNLEERLEDVLAESGTLEGERDKAPGEAVSGATSYTWEPTGLGVRVVMDFDALDRTLAEALQGFGVVPKRGAEVGGILLGSFELDAAKAVRIRDVEPVPCEYRFGPSYLLSDVDLT